MDLIAIVHAAVRHRTLLGARRLAPMALAIIGLGLAGCSSSLLTAGAPPGSLPEMARQLPPAQQPPAPTSREHQRILAAYGGAYDDPKLEGLLNETVAKLVAASERPEVHYRVTILNSASVNAFALPTGQLYVTRGLIALANDTSELASVLSHEMSHVTARHAAIREDQARQVALVSRVVQDVLSDPETGALALAKSKIALASFSRAQEFEADGIGVGVAARAGYDPYGAARFLTSMGRNAELKSTPAQSHIDPRAPDFLSSHPATPERIKNAQASARQLNAPSAVERDKAAYLASIEGLVYGEDPSEGFVRGRRFLHPKLGFTFLAPEGFTLDNTAQAVLGVKESGVRPCGSTSCACRRSRRSPPISAPAGSRTSTPRASKSSSSTACRRRPRPPRAISGCFGSTRYDSAPTFIASFSLPNACLRRSTAPFASRSARFAA